MADTSASGAGQDSPKRWWIGILLITVLLSGIGTYVGFLLLGAAQQNQTCVQGAQSSSWKGIQISGLPSELQMSFGYGRGTQIVDATLNATAQSGVILPASFAVFVEPLATSDGTQVIPSLSGANSPQAQFGVSAVATQIASSSTYQLQVCVKAPRALAGSYTSQLLFPGATLANGASLPVTVTFQSKAAPFVLTVGIAPLVLLGMLYTTIVLIRRKNSALKLNQIAVQLREQLWSINGIIALVLSVGAVFTAWNVQCYRNVTWGSPWPTILVTLATMAGAAAAASTVPMGLSSQ